MKIFNRYSHFLLQIYKIRLGLELQLSKTHKNISILNFVYYFNAGVSFFNVLSNVNSI